MKKHLYTLAITSLLMLGSYYLVVLFLPLSLPTLPSSTILLDRNSKEIGELIYSGSIRHREIHTEEIPEFYKKSLVALEDRTFWTNNGVDFIGLARSMLHNIQAGRIVEGGSTLSSGLIRNAFWITEERTLAKKILEFLYALHLNHLLTKEQILTEYIDRVHFGYMNYGLKSGAKYYFDREPMNLTKAEQLALLILPKDPTKYDPYKKPKNFRTRFEEVVHTLKTNQGITESEETEILREKLHWNTHHRNTLPYVADFLKVTPLSSSLLGGERTKGEKIPPLLLGEGLGDEVRTTFDRELTEQIDTIAKNTLLELAWRNVSDYGILIAEKITPHPNPLLKGEGTEADKNSPRLQEEAPWKAVLWSRLGERWPELRIMIGGKNYSDSVNGQVNTTLALRQPGSTIKPFTYALAFEKLGLTPESTILDLPTAYETSEGYAYEPKNYSQDYKGEITLRQALSESVNIPAIKLAERVGTSTLLQFLRELRITSLKENVEHYGLGLTLGNGEVSLLELLQAFTIFSHEGKYCPFKILTDQPPSECEQKIDPKYTDMVVSILSDRYAKLGGFPLYSSLDFSDRNVFVKTGTSRNFRDNWAVGFTDHYMIGVWTGNKSGENMKGVSGATGAGEIFRRIVYALEKTEQAQLPEKSIKNSQPYLTITNPLGGALYKQESTRNQKKEQIQLRFETNIPHDVAQWMLDGKKVDTDFINPLPWSHILEIILMQNGEIVKKEKSTFRVEGAE